MIHALVNTLLFVLVTLTPAWAAAAEASDPRLNILFFTADDMNHDSAGCYGCPIVDLTPNLDRLAAEGLRFEYAYSTVAVCQPVRQIMQTGLYPHRSGAMGFFPIRPEVRTLNERLHDAGYLISMFGKGRHHQPAEKFCVDVADDTMSRHPSRLAEATRAFLRRARVENRPFFHNVNCYDPHRPFIGMRGPDDLAEGEPPSRRIEPAEVTSVPGFLEDLPEIRRELAGYYTNVRRMDDALGAVLAVLREEGFAEHTLVVFYGGDHGMSFPFGKSNDYENSSRGGLIVRWPGVTAPGSVDHDHLVSTLDFTPTLLDAAGLQPIPDIDGRSFLAAVRGRTLPGWDRVFTFYNAAYGDRWYPMRCIRTRDRSYIWNAWSDGRRRYQTESMAGLSWKAMLAAADADPAIRARTEFYLHRCPEEFYDLTSDRCERTNLITEAGRRAEIDALRGDLLDLMRRTGDPFAEAFGNRGRNDLVPAVLEKLREEYGEKPAVQPGRKPALQIINGTSAPVEVFWLDDESNRVPQGTVAPGDDTIISTTIGHRFVVVAADGTETPVRSSVPIQAFRVGGVPAFYTQRIDVDGFPIVASPRVNAYALAEAAHLVRGMLAKRPDVLEALVASGARMGILAWNEFTTDQPEFVKLASEKPPGFPGLSGKDFWDARARGLGGSETDPCCVCAEENLLGYPGDPYAAECILIHELAHMIHLRGMNNVDPSFDGRVKQAYDRAVAAGLWKGKYASVNHHEYFAEGVQSWFDDNRVNDHDHNHVHLRSQLVEYDPGLAALCREVFGDTELTYTKPATRLTGHLEGYDPAQAPVFAWPERLAEAKRLIRANAESRGK